MHIRISRQRIENQQKAVKLLESKYNSKIDGIRLKFVTLPEGSIALKNSVGAAPGVITEVDNNYWFSVPGVPEEMLAILNEEIIPFLKSKYTDIGMVERGFNAYGFTEPKILPITEKLQQKYPQFYYKSHPKKDENGKPWLALHIYGFGKYLEKDLIKASNLWRELINEITPGSCTEIKEIFDNEFSAE